MNHHGPAATEFFPNIGFGEDHPIKPILNPQSFCFTLQDHAAAGLGAGVVAVLCMHPLDLLKVKLQIATENPKGGIGKQIWYSLRDIKVQEGWKGLYRGVGPNIAGNASSWGLYFLLYVPYIVSRLFYLNVIPEATIC